MQDRPSTQTRDHAPGPHAEPLRGRTRSLAALLVLLAVSACGGGGSAPNRAPVLGTIGNQSVDEGTRTVVSASATDPEGGTLTFETSALPGFISLENPGTGTVRLIVEPGFADSGDYPITVRVRDGSLASDAETFTLTVRNVNRPPVITAIADRVVAEGQSQVIELIAVDPDDDALVLGHDGLPGFAVLADRGDGTGTLSLQPGFFDSGLYALTLRATDSFAAADETAFTVSVGNVNLAPVLAAIGDQSIAEGQAVAIALGATDPDGDALELEASGLPAFAVLADHGDGTGALVLQPGFLDSGTYMVTISAADPSAASAAETFVVSVANVNRPPFFAPLADQALDEDQIIALAIAASDPDGDALVLDTGPLPGFAAFADNGDGTGTLTLAPGFLDSGDYAIALRAADGAGLLVERTLTVSVANVNRAPSLAPIGDQAVAEGDTLAVALSGTDPDGDALVLTSSGLPAFAALTDDGDGTGTLTLSPGFADSGDYTVTLGVADTGMATDEQTITLSITNVNQAPVLAGIGDRTIDEGAIDAIGLSATDGDGDDIVLEAVGLPAFATLTDNGDGTGTLTLSPDFFASGDYPITMRATDANAATAEETWTLTVNNVNRVPVLAAVADQNVDEGQTIVVALSASDADGDPLALGGVGLPVFATLDDAGDGTGTLTLGPGFADGGDYTIELHVTDGGAVPGVQTFALSVADINRAPAFAAVADQTVSEGETIFIDLSASDPDGDVLALTGVGLPAFASVADLGDGTGILTLQPVFKDEGTYSLVLRATDAGVPSLNDEITFQVTIVYAGPNQVAVENALPGDADWHLDSPATGREIEGYASATSVDRGEPISLFVNTAAPSFTLEVFRMGWYQGLGARRVHGPVVLGGTIQTIPAPDPVTGLVEADWINPYVLDTVDVSTGVAWTTGVYLARLTESQGGKQSYIIFVVRDDAHRPDVLFQLPVTTYQAYNPWGGKSLYDFNSGAAEPWGSTSGTRASHVSFDRPYAANDYAPAAYGMGAGEFLTNVQPVGRIDGAGWDYNMVRWLEYERYDVGYITNIDTHRAPATLQNTDVLLIQGHDEYWSWQMRDNVEAARDAGVDLAFFASNTAYVQVRFEPSPLRGVPDRVIVAYKDDFLDPYYTDADPTNDYLTTVPFRDAPVSRPEASLIGVQYVLDPVDGDIVVKTPGHWVFAGTGLGLGDALRGLLGYEPDGITADTPAGTVVLAESPIVATQPPFDIGTSHMTIYTAASGASVFATGSLQWSWGLDDYNAPALRTSRLNAAAQQITANVLESSGARPFTGQTVTASCIRLVALSEPNDDNSTSAAEIGLLDPFGQELSKTGWTLAYVDSEETVGLDGRAIYAFDGDPTTFWQTEWFGPSHPHEIQIDLGGATQINALRYLPRQDGGVDGRIGDYEIYASTDCATWDLVAAGSFEPNGARKLARFVR